MEKEGLLSCWGRFKLKLPWTQQRVRSPNTRSRVVGKLGGRFKYDPLSYAQNFDEGWDDDDEEVYQRGFSARYAAPSSKPPGDK
ncbi:hypothetical protein I3843_07G159600 [Carya illinoinensis]|nr:hypothetical protein I3843_07G159600 [Carya illinoinensis]